MNLTEKILAKLDKTINDIEFFLSKPRETDSIVELARTHLPVLYALRRQVEKHKDNEQFITEVATDLGISE
jgi:hypothetical protein